MTVFTIDTLEFAKRLRAAGFTQEQSEALAQAHGAAFQEAASHTLATKQDLGELRSELKQDMAELRSELKQDMVELRGELKLLKWGMGITVAAVLIPLLRDLTGL